MDIFVDQNNKFIATIIFFPFPILSSISSIVRSFRSQISILSTRGDFPSNLSYQYILSFSFYVLLLFEVYLKSYPLCIIANTDNVSFVRYIISCSYECFWETIIERLTLTFFALFYLNFSSSVQRCVMHEWHKIWILLSSCI